MATEKIILVTGQFAFVGDTAEEAYDVMLCSDADHNMPTPSECQWYRAVQIGIKFAQCALPKPKKQEVKP